MWTSLDSSGSWGRVSHVLDSCGSFGGRCQSLGATSGRGKPELVYGTLHYELSGTNWLSFGGFKEQTCVVGGVIICVYIIVVQWETMRPRATIMSIEDNEVDCLFTHLWGWCSMLISCQDTINMWAIWRVCTVQSSVVVLGQEVQACCHLVAWMLVGNQVK